MVLVKILRRKDASSIIVAIVLAMIIMQALQVTTSELSATLSGLNEGEAFTYTAPDSNWKQAYLFPIVSVVVQVIVLEVLAWILIAGSSIFGKPSKNKN